MFAPPLIAYHPRGAELALGLLPLGRASASSGRSGGCATTIAGYASALADANARDRRGAATARRASRRFRWLGLLRLSAGVGSRLRQVSERRRLVLLPLLAAEISVRRARLRHQTGGLLRLDSVCRLGHRQSLRRLVFEPPAAVAGASLNFSRKLALGLERRRDAGGVLRDADRRWNWRSCCSASRSSGSNRGPRW